MRNLAAVLVDGLVEVTLPIEDPNSHERDAQVTRGLAVVARQDTQATRVNGQAFMEAELGAEVGDQVVIAVDSARLITGKAFALLVVGIKGSTAPAENLP